MSILKFYISVFLMLNYTSVLSQSKSKSVSDILLQTQKKAETNTNFSCSMEYRLYPTYNHKTPSEQYSGAIIKHVNNYYIQINNTVFLTDLATKTSLKLNTDEKAMMVVQNNTFDAQNQSPLEMIKTYTSLFKTQTVKDIGNQWLCTLTSDVITQLPYGKIEIYINKSDYTITKQILYFLAQYPYKDAKGNEVLDNPRLEISIADYKASITKNDERLTKLSTYIKSTNNTIQPIGSYKDFKIIKN